MKRYLDIFGDFLCNNREIMVISSLLCSVTYFLPGLFFYGFLGCCFSLWQVSGRKYNYCVGLHFCISSFCIYGVCTIFIIMLCEVIMMKKFLKEYGRFSLICLILVIAVIIARFYVLNVIIGCMVLFLGIVLGVVPLVYGLVHPFQKQDK